MGTTKEFYVKLYIYFNVTLCDLGVRYVAYVVCIQIPKNVYNILPYERQDVCFILDMFWNIDDLYVTITLERAHFHLPNIQ
jgi:hypothetical protein